MQLIMKTLIIFLFLIFYSNLIFAQKVKDSLFIKFDTSLLSRENNLVENSFYYRIEGTGNNGFTFFKEKKIVLNITPGKVYNLKDLLKDSDIYFTSNHINSQKRELINDWKLLKFFENYIIFLVKNDSLIKVDVIHEIE